MMLHAQNMTMGVELEYFYSLHSKTESLNNIPQSLKKDFNGFNNFLKKLFKQINEQLKNMTSLHII